MIDRTLSHYRINAKIGQGGMGDVYRAADTKLGREVAIKVLPSAVSGDPQAIARLEREAKALAALNHPNIASIHGFDADQHTYFIVLELVEGETLCERLRRGKLPLDESLRIARQIAEALEAAHAKGIVHRDLKPGNIKFTSDGRVKVLDFGLAKLAAGAGSEDVTLKTEQTTPGAILGTPAYMSPEQARGQEVDKRTDVWAFGCCLFECLSGSKPFRGDTVTDLMAEVLKSEPGWSALPADVPREVLTLLRRCLEKDPRRRLSSLGDIAILLEDSHHASAPEPAGEKRPRFSQPPRGNSLISRLAMAIGFLSLLGGLAITALSMWRQAKAAAPSRQIRSLAVLPFEENIPDPKLAGLGRSIPAEIRSKLGSLENLQVVNAPAKIEQLRQQKKSEIQIAEELNVEALVLGELHQQGEEFTLFVSVVDGHTGRNIVEPRRVSSPVANVSELPTTAALALVNELKLQITAAQRSGLAEPETRNSEAFFALYRGLDLFSRRQWDQGASEFRKAYELDGNFARAWVELASAQWVPLAFGGTTNNPGTVFQRLLTEAERFQGDQKAQRQINGLRAWIALLYERDWAKVRRLYWQVQDTNKARSPVFHPMSFYYAYVEGHIEEALQLNEFLMSLEPDLSILRIDHAHLLTAGGRAREAMDLVRAFPPEQIKYEDFSQAALLAGDLPAAKEIARRVLRERPHPSARCNLAAIHAKLGEADEARKILNGLEQDHKAGILIPFGSMAWAYGCLGDFEAAQRCWREGVRDGRGDWSTTMLRTAPNLALFGKFPWYWELVDEMKFPPLQMDHPYYTLEQEMRFRRGPSATPFASSSFAPRTLAVLPFEKIGTGGADDAFNEGLTIELITLLQNIRELKVQGPMASMQFKGATDPKQVGEKLKVDHLLQGKVSRSGDRLRINLSLQKAADGFGLWATNYDRKLSDIFAIQTEVAQKVADALKITLRLEENQALEHRRSGDAEAYSLYMQGRAAWNYRNTVGFTRAVEFYSQALQKAPQYALALAGLADVHVVWPVWDRSVSVQDHRTKTLEFARKALEMDPMLAEPHAALGWAYALYDWNWERAEREFQTAILLNPNSANSIHWYSDMLLCAGRYEEALRFAEKALQLDATPIQNWSYVKALFAAGQRSQAFAFLQDLIKREPSFRSALYWLLLANGDFDQAFGVLKSEKLDLANAESRLAHMLAATANRDAAVAECIALQASGKADQYHAAKFLLLVGAGDEAVELVEKLVSDHTVLDPEFLTTLRKSKFVRESARYQEILKKLNFPK